MTTKKGLAVISSGGDAKHLLYDTADASAAMAELGADDVVSTIHTTVDVKDMTSDLASTLNTASSSVETRITTSIVERNAIRGEMDNVAARLGAQENASDTDRYTYVADVTAGSTIGAAASFAGADQLLANKLVTTAQSIATLEGGENDSGSVDEAIDKGKKDIKEGIVVGISTFEGKVGVAVGITKELTKKYDAVTLVKTASEILGGKGGGGRKDFAQAGGSNKDNIEKAFEALNKKIS